MNQDLRRIERDRALKFHAAIGPQPELERRALRSYFAAPVNPTTRPPSLRVERVKAA